MDSTGSVCHSIFNHIQRGFYMKNYSILLYIIALCFLGTSFSAYATGITGTKHDFSGQSWTTNSEICIVCHTPHNAKTTVTDAPLWNHQVTSATYTLYSSPTLNATMAQPTSSSKLCLSCHDGTVALENFGNVTTGTQTMSSSSLYFLGTNLSNDHPISFDYSSTLATNDGGLKDPSTATVTLGTSNTGTIAAKMLFNGKLECASCHDVHNKYNTTNLLVKSNTNSALCLACHTK